MIRIGRIDKPAICKSPHRTCIIQFLDNLNCDNVTAQSGQYEPPHDKTNKMTVRPAKTQINLGIRPVWSKSSLCAQWVAEAPMFLQADSEDSDQTGQMRRLIWVFAGRTCHFVGSVMSGSFNLKLNTNTRPLLWFAGHPFIEIQGLIACSSAQSKC